MSSGISAPCPAPPTSKLRSAALPSRCASDRPARSSRHPVVREKLAIFCGKGIAGLAALTFLHLHFDLTLYEKNDYACGHTNPLSSKKRVRPHLREWIDYLQKILSAAQASPMRPRLS